MKKILSTVLCLMFVLQSFIVVPLFTEEAKGAFINHSRMLKTLGNKIVLADDESVVVRLTGMNVPGGEWTGTPATERLTRSMKEAMENWDSNIIRLCVSIEGWFGQYDYVKDGGAGYRKYIDSVIQMASEAGKYVILDLHQYKAFDSLLDLYFWDQASDIYKNNPTVLFGILNEPHGVSWEVWRNGDGSTYTGHQQVLERIRDRGAKNIIVAGGLDYAYNLKGIAGESGDGINYELIDQGTNNDLSKKGNGIIYDTHIYPWKGWRSGWHSAVGSVRKKHPILVGENGYDPSDGVQKQYAKNVKHEEWVPELFEWMNDEETYGNLANWTGWCFHPSSTPRILLKSTTNVWGSDDYVYTPTEFWGVYVKDQLKKDLGINVVQGKTVTSSASLAGFGGVNAIDGDDTTPWKTDVNGDKWLKIDLGSQRLINRWTVRHATANVPLSAVPVWDDYNTTDFRLQVSDDGNSWTNADVIMGNTVGVTDRFIRPTLTRYLRLYITKPAPNVRQSLVYEFGAYASTIPVNQVAQPQASMPSGNVPLDTPITLTTTTPDATIKYTTDGSVPTVNSTTYEGPVPMTITTTLRAIAIKNEMMDSEVSTYTYTVPALEAISVENPKTVYYKGEPFDGSEGVLSATYAGGFSEEIPLDSDKIIVTGFQPTKYNSPHDVTITYKGLTSTYSVLVRDTLKGDYEIVSDMNTSKPGLWDSWNGTTSSYVAGAAQDGEGSALVISGGTNGGGCELSFESADFGSGEVTHPDEHVTNGFIGASYMVVRLKSTADFNVRFRLEYRQDTPATVKDSKPFTIPSTDGEWKDVVIPFSELADEQDPTWIYNMLGTGSPDYQPVILLRLEDVNFGVADTASIGEMRVLWYNEALGNYTVGFNANGGQAVDSFETTPYSRITLPLTTRNNFRFGGWYKDVALTMPWIQNTDRVSDSMTLYAKWGPANSYAVCDVIKLNSTVAKVSGNLTGELTTDICNYSGADKSVYVWTVVHEVSTSKRMVSISNKVVTLPVGQSNVKLDDINVPNATASRYSVKVFVWSPDSQNTISTTKAVTILN